ncbi:MAG: glycosyltransferase family 1 protein, partial [Patescibacteria group bacterium]|nr:glycosyltransferase family 1 protein [Patescibacteria group bacterium]
ICFMKIGIDISTLMDAYFSGVSEYSYNLIKKIIEKDKKNEYILYFNSFAPKNFKINFFKYPDVKVIQTRYPNKIFNHIMQNLFKFPKVDKFLGKVDLFFSPHLNFYNYTNAPKKIITIHDLSFVKYPEFFSLRKNLWHKMINIKKIPQKYDKIIAVSHNTKNDLIELFNIPENKIQVIYSGIENDMRKISEQELNLIRDNYDFKQKYNLPNKFILYLGTIEPRKNIENTIKAFEVFLEKNPKETDYKLVIAGGSGWKNKNIFKTWKNSAQKNNIKFIGYIDKNDKKYLYNLASLFIFSSYYEGFGFPPLEALACGCPVITANNSSLSEIIGDYSTLINPYDISSIAKAIELHCFNKINNNIFLEKFANIKEEYSWDKCAKKYLDFFEDINKYN